MVEMFDDAEQQPPNLKSVIHFQDRKGVRQSVPLKGHLRALPTEIISPAK